MNRRRYLVLAAGAALAPRHARRVVSPRVDGLAREHLGLYSSYGLRRMEHVGTRWSPRGRQDAVEHLLEHGYEYNVLAAAKRHPEDGRIDDGSYRKVPAEHPDLTDYDRGGASIVDEWDPADCQYHVHLFDTGSEGVVELYSHYELRPDLFEPSVSPTRVRSHYRPSQHETYLFGVSDPGVEEYCATVSWKKPPASHQTRSVPQDRRQLRDG